MKKRNRNTLEVLEHAYGPQDFSKQKLHHITLTTDRLKKLEESPLLELHDRALGGRALGRLVVGRGAPEVPGVVVPLGAPPHSDQRGAAGALLADRAPLAGGVGDPVHGVV